MFRTLLPLASIAISIFGAMSFAVAPAHAATSQTRAPARGPYSLSLDLSRYEVRTISVDGVALKVRAYEQVVYVAKPVDLSTQVMNIYIPQAYFEGGRVGRYDAQTAPIFLPNNIGGYMPSRPAALDHAEMRDGRLNPELPGLPPMHDGPPAGRTPGPGAGMPGLPGRPDTIALALSRGYVVAAPGTRGRTSRDSSGTYIGKAPAAIVDLKAAVRYLRYNDARMPGNAEHIISNGTSAGGALSALLGASGNSPDFDPYLKALGAALARDDIFAVSAYCPITNLEHADAAYEWQFDGIYGYKRIDLSMLDFHMERKEVAGVMTAGEIAVSRQLKALFPRYVNGLHIRGPQGQILNLDETGDGTLKDHIASLIMSSAQTALDEGRDMRAYSWLTVRDGKVHDINFAQYLEYLGRQKNPPAFDGLDLQTGENQLFGNKVTDSRHFTAFSAAGGGPRAEDHLVAMMNPMHYVGAPHTQNARYWRIRHGTKDRDTSLAIPVLLASALQNRQASVDFAFAWDRPHSGDYDLNALFAWVDTIVQ
jgi:hypothetical protein